jgi:hypothetical protein
MRGFVESRNPYEGHISIKNISEILSKVKHKRKATTGHLKESQGVSGTPKMSSLEGTYQKGGDVIFSVKDMEKRLNLRGGGE